MSSCVDLHVSLLASYGIAGRTRPEAVTPQHGTTQRTRFRANRVLRAKQPYRDSRSSCWRCAGADSRRSSDGSSPPLGFGCPLVSRGCPYDLPHSCPRSLHFCKVQSCQSPKCAQDELFPAASETKHSPSNSGLNPGWIQARNDVRNSSSPEYGATFIHLVLV